MLRSQSGQSLVELALLTPLLLLLLIGTVEMGRYAYIDILVANAARAGAAYGALSLPQSVDTKGIQTAAYNDFQNNGLTTSSLTVNSSTACGCDSGGTTTLAVACTGGTAGTCGTGHWVVMVSVTASGTFNSLFKFPGIPKSLAMTHTATMRVVQD
jgi:Flp pilus assembly protein TadG